MLWTFTPEELANLKAALRKRQADLWQNRMEFTAEDANQTLDDWVRSLKNLW